MPLTLIELQSLIDALGVQVPEDILQQRAKEEQFTQRRSKLLTDSSSKAADWYLKPKFDAALKAADEAAGKKQFDPALNQLDQGEELLKQPDIAPETLAAVNALGERKATLEAEIARAKGFESAIGNELKAALLAVAGHLDSFNAEPATKGLDELDNQLKDLVAAQARVDTLKKQTEKEMSEADAAVKAIGDPTITAPETQKFEALKTRQTTAGTLTDTSAQEKEFSAILRDIATLKQDAAAAKKKVDDAKAAQQAIAQLTATVDTALTDTQKAIDAIKEKSFKDGLNPRMTPLTQERTRIGTLSVPADQEAALKKLQTDVAAVRKDADNRAAWDQWLTASWEPWSKSAKDWIDSLKEQSAKTTLQAAWDALIQEKNTNLAAGQLAALEKTTYPKMQKLHATAMKVSNHGAEVEKEIYKQRNLMIAVMGEIPDASITEPLRLEYNAIDNTKRSSWPGGNSVAAMNKAMDDFDVRIAALKKSIEDARSNFVGTNVDDRKALLKQIKQQMQMIDQMLSEVEKTDWKKVAKLPPAEGAPMLKLKPEFETSRKSYEALEKRLTPILKFETKNPSSGAQALGGAVLAVGKEVQALMELVMRAMTKVAIKRDGAAKVDQEIADMPDKTDDPTELAMCKALIEARYGIKIEIGEEFKAKSLPRIGKMLARVPAWQTKQTKKAPDGSTVDKSLKTLEYGSEPKAKGNYYSSSRKAIALQGMTEKGDSNDEHRLVADSGKVTKTSYFDFTTLHEIGHAVDDRIGFMKNRMNQDGFGKWNKETFQSVLDAFLPSLVADCSGGTKKAQPADLQAMLTDLLKTGTAAKPANATAKLGSLFDEWDQIQVHAVVVKCKKGMFTKANPWDKGKSHAQATELGGRVYQEAYDNDWYSYQLADRAKTGMTTYQWRAPGEWFAELYALYYLNKLGRSHPMSSWFRNSATSEAKARKV